MNRRRIVGLLLLACIAVLLVIRGCLPSTRAPETPPAPPRPAFDPTKAFAFAVMSTDRQNVRWLERELNSLLSLAGLPVAPKHADARGFQVQMLYGSTRAELKLIAPDRLVDRRQSLQLTATSRLQIAQELLHGLLTFIGTKSNSDVDTALDFDPAAFEALMQAMDELLGDEARGFTDVGDKVTHAAAIAKLESIAQQHANNPRALGALALGYLSVGGPDHQSLLDLAEQTAQRALTISQSFADTHAALGLVAFRRNQWVSARESFDRALKSNANDLPALEGLACSFANTGQMKQAKIYGERALALQPQNIGAHDCLRHAEISSNTNDARPLKGEQKLNAAVLGATVAILSQDPATAHQLLSSVLSHAEMKSWGAPLLDAAQTPAHISSALRNITEAALDGRIGNSHVLLAGIALRKSDFVFNRLARMRADHEPEPLRVLWLPQASFLRKSPRFEHVVSEADLPGYWHEYGRPDICNREPTVYGCGATEKPPRR
jgi:tetratricopeptide (TPR) repeat protein